MAAPANIKCEKCFNTVPVGAATCPECGAPVGDATVSDSEAAIYPELARANLARMRGDYKQAEDQLLSVLKRYPNNPSANEMLGDLAAEREDFVHAVEWYEMALEIVPTSASIARKVKDSRARIEKKDSQDTTAQLGLPDPSSRMPLVVGGLITIILAVGIGAYILGARGGAPTKTSPTVRLQAQPEPQPSVTGGGETVTPKQVLPAGVAEDETLKQTLTAKAEDASAILGVSHDPRSASLTVTFAMTGQNDKALAARIARATFASITGYDRVTLRGVADGKVAFVADSERSKIAETETPEWKQQHESDPEGWIGHVLQNEWPVAPATPAETQGSTGTEPVQGNSSSTTAGGGGTPSEPTGGGQ